ncbi:NAD-dependent epimerase/dehydratase family protein [Stenotrophomonas sp.]|uniref:NAD-dependent epimerase/dehydratase family protein n=1 Tax=Stenotrophomonas sp. TaxID=69392 RepID=UPI003340414F
MSNVFNQKIVIPGGAGLVGQNLVAILLRQGYRNLVVIDKHEANLAILRRMHPALVTALADLADAGTWEEHFVGADAVVMLQAQIGGTDPLPFVRNNLTATQNILSAIQRHAVPYTVHVSSSVVCSVAEDDYTRTKREQEQLVAGSGIAAVILRPTLMFGWFDRKHLGWLSRFMRKVPVFPIPGDGRFMRQPLYAGDFAAIIASCLRSRMAGQRYNITGLEKVDYVDIIAQIKRSTGARSILLHIPYGLFHVLLKTWALFDRDPPFTAAQLKALVAHDEFEVIDWPGIFGVQPTPFAEAIEATFNDPEYGDITLEF